MKTESNCRVLGTGRKTEDFAHISKSTPLDLKRREFEESKQYRTDLAPDINQVREKAVSLAPTRGNVCPLGGN